MKALLSALLAVVAVIGSPPALAYTQAELDLQLKLLMEWWSGEFDNNEQIVRQSGGGLSPLVAEPHFRIHGHYHPVEFPAAGEHVIYIEEYKHDDPQDIYRIRLMSLHTDSEANGIRVELFAPLDQAALVGSHRQPDRVTATDLEQWRAFSRDCAVFLTYEGSQFAGGMRSRTCKVDAERGSGKKDAWFDYRVVVGPKSYWFKDVLRRLEDDSVVWELAPGSNDFFQADRARWFTCVVNYNLESDMTKTERLTEVSLHDQGGRATIAYPPNRQLSLVLHNRAFTQPANNRFRILRLHEDNPTVPLAYGYADTRALRFGLNLGWFYTLCRPSGEAIGG